MAGGDGFETSWGSPRKQHGGKRGQPDKKRQIYPDLRRHCAQSFEVGKRHRPHASVGLCREIDDVKQEVLKHAAGYIRHRHRDTDDPQSEVNRQQHTKQIGDARAKRERPRKHIAGGDERRCCKSIEPDIIAKQNGDADTKPAAEEPRRRSTVFEDRQQAQRSEQREKQSRKYRIGVISEETQPDQNQPGGEQALRDQQRREMLRRMWRRVAGGDPLDMVA